MAEHDSPLKSHLEHPKLKNATNLSPRIQNHLLMLLGNSIIQSSILKEVHEAKYFSLW